METDAGSGVDAQNTGASQRARWLRDALYTVAYLCVCSTALGLLRSRERWLVAAAMTVLAGILALRARRPALLGAVVVVHGLMVALATALAACHALTGMLAYRLNLCEVALPHLTRARRDPQPVSVHLAASRCLERLGKHRAVLEALLQAVDASTAPRGSLAKQDLARIHLEIARRLLDERLAAYLPPQRFIEGATLAGAHLATALKLDENLAVAHTLLAYSAVLEAPDVLTVRTAAEREIAQAEQLFEQAAKAGLAPDPDAQAAHYYWSGMALRRLGEYTRASTAFGRARDLNADRCRRAELDMLALRASLRAGVVGFAAVRARAEKVRGTCAEGLGLLALAEADLAESQTLPSGGRASPLRRGLSHARRALTKLPQVGDAYTTLCLLQAALQDHEELRRDARRWVHAEGDKAGWDPYYWLMRACVEAREARVVDSQAARSALRIGHVRGAPELTSSMVDYLAGWILLNDHEVAEALEPLRRAANTQRADAVHLYAIALFNDATRGGSSLSPQVDPRSMRELQRAAELFESLGSQTDAVPWLVTTLQALLEAYVSMDRELDRAEVLAQRVIALTGGSPRAYADLAWVRVRKLEVEQRVRSAAGYRDAQHELQRSLLQIPTDDLVGQILVGYRLAFVDYRLGYTARARAGLAKVIEEAPSYEAARNLQKRIDGKLHD